MREAHVVATMVSAVALKRIALVVTITCSLLTALPAAAIDNVVYCGVVAVNSIRSGQGSGPRTYELQVTTGPGGGLGRFGVPESMVLPNIGSYICGQFAQGAPMMGLVALLLPGDAGYVAQAAAAPSASAPSAVPTTVPVGVAQPQPGLTLGFIQLLLMGLALLGAMALLTLRARRATT